MYNEQKLKKKYFSKLNSLKKNRDLVKKQRKILNNKDSWFKEKEEAKIKISEGKLILKKLRLEISEIEEIFKLNNVDIDKLKAENKANNNKLKIKKLKKQIDRASYLVENGKNDHIKANAFIRLKEKEKELKKI